jgi:hypothetical protein
MSEREIVKVQLLGFSPSTRPALIYNRERTHEEMTVASAAVCSAVRRATYGPKLFYWATWTPESSHFMLHEEATWQDW